MNFTLVVYLHYQAIIQLFQIYNHPHNSCHYRGKDAIYQLANRQEDLSFCCS